MWNRRTCLRLTGTLSTYWTLDETELFAATMKDAVADGVPAGTA